MSASLHIPYLPFDGRLDTLVYIELSVTSFVTVCITTGRNIILAMSYLLLTGGTNPRMMATR